MSQQQLTESQKAINHELLIETETKFRNALTASKSTDERKQLRIVKTTSPFTKEGGMSKLCFRYTKTMPHNNTTEDDNLKNKN